MQEQILNELNSSNNNQMYNNSKNAEKPFLIFQKLKNKDVKIINDSEEGIFTNKFDFFLKKHNIKKFLLIY